MTLIVDHVLKYRRKVRPHFIKVRKSIDCFTVCIMQYSSISQNREWWCHWRIKNLNHEHVKKVHKRNLKQKFEKNHSFWKMIKSDESLLCFLICFSGIVKVTNAIISLDVVWRCIIWCSECGWTLKRPVFLLWQSKCPSYGIPNRFEYSRGTIYESLWLVLMAKHFPRLYRRLSPRQYLRP